MSINLIHPPCLALCTTVKRICNLKKIYIYKWVVWGFCCLAQGW